MKAAGTYDAKVMSLDEAVRTVARWRLQGRTVVFTNGCFDILHAGHLDLLERASSLGDRLVLGVNADAPCGGSRARNGLSTTSGSVPGCWRR